MNYILYYTNTKRVRMGFTDFQISVPQRHHGSNESFANQYVSHISRSYKSMKLIWKKTASGFYFNY